MGHIEWHDKYKIGVDFIDKEHMMLFLAMDKLLKISKNEDKSEWACREGVKYLKNHTVEHFEHEEEYMRSINYSGYEIHKRLHDNFRNQTLPALEKELEDTHFSEDSIRHFLGVCIGWVIAHSQTEDQAISGKTASKWTDIPHEEEKEALEQAIVQIFHEIFNINVKLISEQYAGEDFGKVICNRFIYRGQENEKWEVTIILEEQLLLNIVGEILNTQYTRVDDMVINVIRYILRQFLEQIRERFPTIGLYELEKESLLTHDQLLDSFERSNPPCSLLFDTGNGYFSFCAATTDSIRGKIISSINQDNAMSAIKQYLSENSTPKRKILIVDDSEFMRSRINSLLNDSYEVTEADSSISAIKSLAVNRPDLVLMDYEMPICDGRQALEMIRSDKAIADIPVMFLTGKDDIESVRKVMSLKPKGYLLKTLPDDELKKTIDEFFGKKNA